MNRNELQTCIAENYHVTGEFLWEKYPNYQAFRHPGNRKWFALVMDVPKAKLGLTGEGTLDVVDVKCDPLMIGSMRKEPGIYPAYRMSKDSWITVALDGTVPDETIQMLLDMSYRLTEPKPKRKATKGQTPRRN